MLRALFAAVLLITSPAALAQRPEIVYRRIFVPQEAIDGQVRGLLPMRRDEFERRIAQATAAGDPLAGQAVVRIESATYRARLAGDELQGGTAELQIASHADGPALASLSPLSLSIESAQWPATSRPAVLGVDPAGVLQCLVEKEGTLQFAWTLRGERPLPESLAFDVRLPPSPRTRLLIDAPAEVQLAADRGIVSVGAGDAPSRKLWTIELDGWARTRLEVRRETPRAPDNPLVVARTAANYTVLRSAIDLDATLTLDVLRQPARELRLAVDAPLEITSVRLGQTPLEWAYDVGRVSRPVQDESGDLSYREGQRTVRVELPSPLAGVNRTIQVTASAPWPGDQRYVLPWLRVLDASFQEGEATVAAPRWMRLAARSLRGGFQSGVTAGGAAGGLDQFRFQFHTDDAQIEIAADPLWSALHEQSGTQIQIDATQVSGVLIAEISSRGGEVYSLDALVPRHWIVDSVETQPADMLADRAIVPRGTGDQRLRLALRRPIVEGRPLRLVLRGHFRRPAGDQPLADDFFRLATFPAVREGRRLVALRVTDPGVQLELAGEERTALRDPQSLTAAERRLFDGPPGPIVFEAAAAGQSPLVALVPTAPRYRADVLVQAMVGRRSVQQTATIVCRPESSSVHWLLVQVAPRPDGPIAWSIVGEEPRELSAALVPDEERGDAEAEGALYRLTLQRPRSGPVQIRGQWTAAAGEHDAALVWLPQATAHEATAEVHSLDGGPLSIQAVEMSPLASPAPPSGRLTTLRGRYRYEAGRRAQLRIRPQSAARAHPAAWIESLAVASRFAASGHGDHDATFVVENTGAAHLAVRLPDDAADVRLVRERGESGTALARGAGGELLVPLPPGQRRAEVRLNYQSSGRPVGMRPIARLVAPLPQADVPVLARSWSVSLSPRLATMEGASGAPRRTDAAFAGWTTHDLDLPAGTHAAVRVYRPAVVRAWAICIALIAAAGALRTSVGWSLPLAGLMAAGAIVTPPPLAWLLGGASLGAVLGIAAVLVRPRPVLRTSDPDSTLSLSATIAAPAAPAAVLCWLSLSSALWGAPGDAPAAESRPRVVIPVDDEQRPTGDYVFLAPELYDALHKLADNLPTALPAWLLESARYELPAAVEHDGIAPTVGELKAHFEFHTFQPAATIRLPLKRSQLLLLEGRARLDGQPVTPAWQTDGAALLLTVDMPGRHHLDLAFGARAAREDDAARLSLEIPPAARAVAQLPADASGVSVRTAAGAIPAETSGGVAAYRLAAARQLDVRWPLEGDNAARPSMVEGDQLLWWRIRPGSVVLEGRFRLRPVGGAVRGATLTVDPRLRMAPGAAVPPIGRVTVEEGAQHQVRVELLEPAASEVELRLTWLWPGASGIGTLNLPQVELQSDRLIRRWTAVSVDPALVLPALPADAAADAAEFVQAWGAGAAPPTAVLADSSAPRTSTLVVRPVEALPRAEQTVEWSISSLGATAHLAAHLTGVPSHRLEHRLRLAPQVGVIAVELEQEDRPAAIRWSRQADGELVVTLLEGAAAEQTLKVRAELPLARQRPRFPLPAMQLDDVSTTASTLRIYRQPDVRIEVQRAAGWTVQDDPALGRDRPPLGRLAAVLARVAARGEAQPVVVRQPNAPTTTGAMLIHVGEDDGDWWTRIRLALEVQDGSLDELRLVFPGDWIGSLEIEPAVEHEWLDVPGQPRQLLIRPQRAVTDKLELAIRGSLLGSNGIRVPSVQVAGQAAVERFVLLDARAASEQIAWETAGLQPVEPSAAHLPMAWLSAGELFRAGPQFDAVARFRQPTRAAPQVHLADVQLLLHPANRVVGRAAFAVQPAGAGNLELALPAGTRLVQTLVDGLPAQMTQSGLRRWTIATPSQRLPFQVTVVYDGALTAEPRGTMRLAAPEFAGIAPRQICWTIDDAASRPWRPAGGLEQTAAAAVELARLEAAANAISDTAAAGASGQPADAVAAVYRAWKQSRDGALARLREDAPPEGLSRAISERIQAAEETASTGRRRLVQAGILGPNDAEPLPGEASFASAEALYLVTADAKVAIAPAPPISRWENISLPALAAGLLAGLSLVAWPLAQAGAPRRWLLAHAHFALALAGVAWWLALPLRPAAWLGWLLVVAAVWLSLRWPWRTIRHETGSTIRRLPRGG